MPSDQPLTVCRREHHLLGLRQAGGRGGDAGEIGHVHERSLGQIHHPDDPAIGDDHADSELEQHRPSFLGRGFSSIDRQRRMNASGRQCIEWHFILRNPNRALGSSRERLKSSPPPAPLCAQAASVRVSGTRQDCHSGQHATAKQLCNRRHAGRPCAPRWRSYASTARINFSNSRAPGRDVPAVEGPEMDPLSQALANELQPGKAGMGGFRHRSLHVELEDGFRAAGTLLGQPPPARMTHARRAVATQAVANEIDVDVLARRPMALEVRRGTLASQASAHAPRSSATETRSRGRCRPTWASPRPACLPAIRQHRVASSISSGMVAAEPRSAVHRPRLGRRADPSNSQSASPRLNSRCRCVGRMRTSHATALNRSKRSASWSRSGRSLARPCRCMVPPFNRFRASSIGPSF